MPASCVDVLPRSHWSELRILKLLGSMDRIEDDARAEEGGVDVMLGNSLYGIDPRMNENFSSQAYKSLPKLCLVDPNKTNQDRLEPRD
jgi:hypothetical protein